MPEHGSREEYEKAVAEQDAVAVAAEKAKATEPKPEEPRFPSLANGPAVVYENERHEVWVGIPFDKIMEPTLVMACLDRAKYDALLFLSNYHAQLRARQQLSVSPLGGKIKKTMSDIFAAGKSLIS